MLQGINENTRLLFLKGLNDLDNQLKKYTRTENANKKYIEWRNTMIQDFYNFYNEVEKELQNRKFNNDVFVFNQTGDYKELVRLREENRRLKAQLNGGIRDRQYRTADKEAFRQAWNARQRKTFNY